MMSVALLATPLAASTAAFTSSLTAMAGAQHGVPGH
jgi:hypothetical protein